MNLSRRPLGEQGLRGAFERLKMAERGDDLGGSSISLIECTMWLEALSEQVDIKSPPSMGGFRWARNRGIHQLIDLSTKGEGMVFPVTFPMRFEHVAWRDRCGLEMDGAHKAQRKLEPVYDEYLAGRPVRTTIRDAAEALGVDNLEGPT